MNKKQVRKFIKNAIEEREYKIIFHTLQSAYLSSEDGVNAVGAEKVQESIEYNKKQVDMLQKEINFFKKYATGRI